MKKKIFLFSLFLISISVFANKYKSVSSKDIASNAQKIILNEVNGSIKYIKLSKEFKVPSEKKLDWLKSVLKISTNESFSLYGKETDRYGFTHFKYNQVINGIPLENGIYYIHTKNGFVISANGEYYPNILLKSASANLSPSKANMMAYKTIKGIKSVLKSKNNNLPTKVLTTTKKGNYVLAYKIDVYSHSPLSRKYVYIDATSGAVIKEVNRIRNADALGMGATKYSGNQTITTDSLGPSSYILKDNGRNIHTRDLNNSFFISGAVDFTDTDNIWNNINTDQDEVATDAHWAAASFYDYFSTTFGRNSYDNAGAPLNTYVHYGINYNNAFWDGTSVNCGDGDGTTHSPYTALDIIAHEFSHGITENTANLVGTYESGALAESYSDIFSTAIEFYAKPGSANYTFGENSSISGTPTRSLSNPKIYGHPDTYLGTNWVTGPADNGGIHTNNGVQNFWFYLLSNGGAGTNDNSNSYSVTGIGIEKAVRIAYRTLTVYLTSNSQYTDARNYSIQAAVDLYGACSSEAVATQNAWHAVGIGIVATNSPVVANFSSNVQFSCSVPTSVNFTDLSQNATTSYKWYFGDGDSSSVASPSHTYTVAGLYTVTLIVEGVGSCGIQADTLIQTNYINITNGGGPLAINCSPTTSGASTLNMGVYNFTLNTIDHTTALGGTDSYQDYSCSQSTNLTEGNSYSISVTTGRNYNEDVKIWIDFDNNGVFNTTSEKIFESDNIRQNHSGTINIPSGTTLNTPLRLRVSSDYYLNNVDICTNPTYGQHEDYTVVIIPNTNPPVADFMADNTVVSIGQAVNFTDLSQNIPTGWTWYFTGATPSNSSIQNPTATYTALGTYPVKLRANNSFGADSLTKTAYINVVNQFNMCSGIDSTNAPSGHFFDSGGSMGNYSNNENCSLLINPGCALDITLSFTNFYSPTSSDYMRVYDGTDATGTLLGNYTYMTTPPTSITANSGSMFITWRSNSSSNYRGWEASWTSTTPTSAPTSNFSISDNNPPLNTIVDFTDLSTNYAGAWTWDFGDGDSSFDQNPSHTYNTPGTYAVQLITDNCFALDTISYNLTVQDSAFISVMPDTLFATSLCGASTAEQLTIINSGNGDLFTSITGAKVNSSASAFFDGFEDGTYNNWNVINAANTYSVIASNPASGNNCLAITGNSNTGLEYSFTPDTVDYFSIKLRSNDISGGSNYCNIGNSSYINGISGIWHSGNNQYRVYARNSYYHTVLVNTDWTHFEFKNINYTSKTFDLFINGALIQAGAFFRDTRTSNMSKLTLFNSDASYSGYYDDIQIGENVAPEWLSVASTDTITAGNDTTLTNVNFDASGLFAGVYNSSLEITSNDSTNSSIIVPVIFTVTGQPLISVTPNNFNFGTLQVGTSTTDTLYIDNNGCDTLKISSLTATDTSFTTNFASFQIPPYSSDTVIITFSPDTIKTYADTVFISNNDTLIYVLVNGIGVGAPRISYNPTSITDTIFGCNDSLTIPITIYNTGEGDLVFNASSSIGNALPLDTVLARLNNSYTSITALIPNIYNFTDGVTGSSISDGGGDMYDTGNILNTNLTSSIPYSDNTIVSNNALGSSGNYFTRKNTGLFIFAADIDNISTFSITGNLGADGSGIADDAILTSTLNGKTYTGFVKRVYNAGDPSINHIVIVEQNASLSHSYLTNTSNENHIVSGLTNTTRIYYLLYASRAGNYINDTETQAIMDEFITILTINNSNNITPNNGTITPSDSTIIYTTFYSAELNSGTQNKNVVLSSNDPLSPSNTIPVSFTVVGAPQIALSDTCLNFGSIMENTSISDTLTVYNNGCDTLFVTNVTSGISEYTTASTSLSILPGDSGVINVSFSPSSVGTFNSSLTIYNNDNDTTICLQGISTPAPIISTNPTSLNVNLSACEDSITVPLTIYNTGGSNLEFTVVGAGNSSGNIEVLALTYGVDMTEEYPNTISAINQYFTNYNLSTINTTNPRILQLTLRGKDVLLIPELESGSAAIFSGFSTVLQNFVTNGGSVVFCGSGPSYAQAIFNTGLFSGNYITNSTSGAMNLLNPTHQLATSITAPVTAPNATYGYNITNTDAYDIAQLNGNSVITYREVGTGKIVLVGFDYYSTNNNASKFIANAIEWAGSSSIPNWLSLSKYNGAVQPADSTIIYTTFYSTGLNGGSYYTDITINSNDPTNPQILVPCTLNVSFGPCTDFTYNNPNSCSGKTDFTDETINNPTSWQWDFGDANSSTSQNPTHTYSSAGNYNVRLIACNANGCDTLGNIVSITNTNGPITATCSPSTTNSGRLGLGIYNFTFSTINNTTALGGTDGYQDYSCTASTVVTEGSTYAVNVTTGSQYNENVRVWIDLNNDGTFNTTNEIVFNSTDIRQTHSGNILIPSNSILNTSLRMRVRSDHYNLNHTSSCSDVTYGQYEDYAITIQSNMSPPIANYSDSILNQCQGIVQFTDLSSNSPTSWNWDFGDGVTSTFQNPFHRFTSAGIYNVKLISNNAYGSSATYSQPIVINSLNAEINVLSPKAINQPINFNAAASGAISWLWDFDDGSLSTLQSPSHTYINTGQYIVQLIATNGNGCTSTVYDTLNITLTNVEEHNTYFTIFPNPNTGTLQILNKSNRNISSISIVNTLGSVVFDFNNDKNHFTSQKIKLSDVSTGIYFVRVLYSDNRIVTQKFLIK